MGFVARRRDRPSEIIGAVIQIQDAAGNKINPATKEQLPSSLTEAGNLKIAIQEDSLNLMKTADYTKIRWGKDVSPFWVHAAEVTAPAAGTALVSKTVSTGKVGYIYGFFISAGEANDFLINWTSGGAAYSVRIPFSGKGALQYIDFTPLNEGLPADGGSTISITNVNAGSAGIVYQARLLYVEV